MISSGISLQQPFTLTRAWGFYTSARAAMILGNTPPMLTSDADILIVPGLGDSPDDHWQSRWEQQLKTARRVAQDDWAHPMLAAWMRKLSDAVRSATKPPVIIGHSLGALT